MNQKKIRLDAPTQNATASTTRWRLTAGETVRSAATLKTSINQAFLGGYMAKMPSSPYK